MLGRQFVSILFGFGFAFASGAYALTASPNPSNTGSFVAFWDSPDAFGYFNPDEFSSNELRLEQNGVTLQTLNLGNNTTSYQFSDIALGTYTLRLEVCGTYGGFAGGCQNRSTTVQVVSEQPGEEEPEPISVFDPQENTYITKVLVGEDTIQLDWNIATVIVDGSSPESARVEGIPAGVSLPTRQFTEWNNNFPVVNTSGTVTFNDPNWEQSHYSVSACVYESTCNHQGCGDPSTVHPVSEHCEQVQEIAANGGYEFFNLPPQVTIQSPSRVADYPVDQPITIRVSAHDIQSFSIPNASEEVQSVELFLTQSAGAIMDTNNRIATLTSASNGVYTHTFTPTSVGHYYLVALARDTLGATSTAIQFLSVQDTDNSGTPTSVNNTIPVDFDRYSIYFGDFDSDGNRDLYFHGNELIILLHGDIVTPIVLPEPDGFAYFGNSDGSFDPAEDWDMTDASVEACLADGSCVEVGEDQVSYGDMNADGHADVFVKSSDAFGSSLLISGTQGETPPQILVEILSSGQTLVLGDVASTLPLFANNLYASTVSISSQRLVVDGTEYSLNQLRETTSTIGEDIAPDENISSAPEVDLPSPTLNAAEIAEIDSLVNIGGEFRVNEMGAATYTIPLKTLAGTAGVAPDISITYSSQGQLGAMGLGWQLATGGAITRCRQSLQIDKNALPIKFDANDRFCLNGQRLLVVSSHSYGAVGAQYKPEIEDGSYVTSHGGIAGHPDYFSVTNKDGSTSYYGNGNNSLLRGRTATGALASSNRHVMTWELSEFQDSVGNKITYHYGDTDEHHRLEEIRYAYGTNTSPSATIDFGYGEKKKSYPYWVSGVKFFDNSLLEKISILESGSEVNNYQLEYNTGVYASGADLVDRLTRVYYCAGENYCSQPLSFVWGHAQAQEMIGLSAPKRITSYNDNFLRTAPGSSEIYDDLNRSSFYQTHIELDINGDGLPDMVAINAHSSDHYYLYEYQQDKDSGDMVSTGSVATIDGDIDARLAEEMPQMQPVDLNADGRSDLAVYSPAEDAWYLYMATPQVNGSWRLQQDVTILPSNLPNNIRFADLNSDGLSDLFYSNGSRFYVHYLKKKTGSDMDTINAMSKAYTYGGADVDIAASDLDTFNFGGVVDFNQDGKIDVLAASITATETLADVEYLPTGASRDFHCDYDVDLDLVLSSDTSFSNVVSVPFKSDNFTVTQTWDEYNGVPTNYPIAPCTDEEFRRRVIGPQLADINGDGLQDIVVAFAEPKHYFDNSIHAKKDPEYRFSTIAYRMGNPDYTFGSQQEVSFNSEALSFYLTDVDSDNDQDIVFTVEEDGASALTWNGSGFDSPSQVRSDREGRSTRYSDINNDGFIDRVEVEDGRMTARYGVPRVNNLITAFANPLGAQTIIQYEPLNHSGAYIKLDGINAEDSATERVCSRYEPRYSPDGSAMYAECVEWRPRRVANATEFYTEINNPFGIEDPSTAVCADKNVPAQEYISAVPVVTAVASSAPINGYPNAQAVVAYTYEGVKIQAGGRGMLGFKSLMTTDLQTGVSTTTEYRQDWPFMGSPKRTVTKTASGQIISESTTAMGIYGIDASNIATKQSDVKQNGTKSLGPIVLYNKESRDKTYDAPEAHLAGPNSDLGVATSDTLLKEVVTTTSVDAWGNVDTLVIDTFGWLDNQWQSLETKTTDNDYFSGDGIRYGRLQRSTVNTSRAGAGSVEKVATFTYYGYPGASCAGSAGLTGLLCSETLSVSDLSHSQAPQTTLHYYDAFGNKAFSKTGTRVSPLVTYDSLGRYESSTYDVFSNASAEGVNSPNGSYSAPPGAVVVKTGEVITRNSQGVPTLSRAYIGNGKSVFQKQAASTLGVVYFKGGSTGAFEETRMQRIGSVGGIENTDNNCPANTILKITSTKAGGATAVTCTDAGGREVGGYHYGFDGEIIRRETRYDTLGRAVEVSEPAIGQPSAFTETSYDVLGRPISATHPFFVTNSQGVRTSELATTAFTYDGYTVTTTSSGVSDGVARVKSETKNALGELTLVTEQGTRSIRYEYDVFGNLARTFDPVGTQSTISYNGLNQKISMSDPDKGNWNYYYNAFGELIQQTDAKNQTTIIDYDFKGRKVVSRTFAANANTNSASPEIHQVWTYDVGAQGLGKVSKEEDLAEGFTKQYVFDALGRVSDTATTFSNGLGGQERFYEHQNYDEFGRVYQSFDAARQGPQFGYNGVENVYNPYGYLAEVKNAANDGGYYYKVGGMDARGNVILMHYGDGNQVDYIYDDTTGLLETINRTGALGTIQSYNATWDHLGNLVEREDTFYGNDPETFEYDEYNRLTRNTLDGDSVDVTYDIRGNITSKSDQQNGATYNYHATKVHAVTSVGSRSLSYDANGNVTLDGDKTLQYTVKDKVKEIETSNHTSRFNYAFGGRYLREDVNGSGATTTTLYVGSVEKIYNADGSIVWKRNIAGKAQISYTQASSGALGTGTEHYFFHDHLGSIVAISDAGGTMQQRMSFDPWGARRKIQDNTWSNESMDDTQVLTLFAKVNKPTTNRGFTSHEMLDEVGIIHMNGRIYDATLGRLLQADPFVQSPTSVGSLNRYAYVMNNPLNATDPTGYIFKKLLKNKVFQIVAIAVVSYFTAGAASSWALAAYGSSCTVMCSIATANLVSGIAGGVAAGFVGGALGAIAAGGNFRQALRAGIIGGVSGAAFGAIGGSFTKTGGFLQRGGGGHMLAHGLVGGVSNVLQGGKFGHGFFSAGFTKLASVNVISEIGGTSTGAILGRTTVAAIVGGTVSEATGGKFANGARTAALGHLVNQETENVRANVAQKGLAEGREHALAIYLSKLDEAMPELNIYEHDFSFTKTPGFKGLNIPGKIILLNERFLGETNIQFNIDELLTTATHELLHTHVDNLLGGRISQTIQGGNLPNTDIHRWIHDRAMTITAWAKVGKFDSRIRPDISKEHLDSFRD